jgi:hypothetical protein
MNFFLRVRKVWTGGISQVVEYLPNRHEALGSNLSTGKKNKNKGKFMSGNKQGSLIISILFNIFLF